LWTVAIAAAFYFILLPLHAWGEAVPNRMLAALAGYTQVITVICAAALTMQAATMFSLIKLNDEFMRSLVFKRISLAALITILLVTVWGLLASAGWAPPFEAIYLYLTFLGAHTSLLPFMNADRS